MWPLTADAVIADCIFLQGPAQIALQHAFRLVAHDPNAGFILNSGAAV
jgi:hypothetical protein